MIRLRLLKERAPILFLVVTLIYLSIIPSLTIVSGSLDSRSSHSASSLFNRKPLNHTREHQLPETTATTPAATTTRTTTLKPKPNLNPPNHLANNDNLAISSNWATSNDGLDAQSGENVNTGASLESPNQTLNIDQLLDETPMRTQSGNDISKIEDALVNQITEQIAQAGYFEQKFDELPTRTIQMHGLGKAFGQTNAMDNANDTMTPEEITGSPYTLSSVGEHDRLGGVQQDVADSGRIQYDLVPHQYLAPVGGQTVGMNHRSSKLVVDGSAGLVDSESRNYTLGIIRPQRHSEPAFVQASTQPMDFNLTQKGSPTSAANLESNQSTDAATNKLAPANASTNHQQPLELSSSPAAAAAAGQARSGSIQARSMYSKTPQHTKPPYATNDLFSQRSPTPASANQASGDQSAQVGQRLTSRNALPPKNGQLDDNSISQANGFSSSEDTKKSSNNSNQQDIAASHLLNSLDRISSELVSDASTRTTSKAQSEREQQQQRPQNNAQYQKLASTNHIDLNPIPNEGSAAVTAYAENGNLPPKGNSELDTESIGSNYDPTPLNRLLSFYPQSESSGQRQQTLNSAQGGNPNKAYLGHHNDRYGSHSNSEQAELLPSYMEHSALVDQAKNQDDRNANNNKLDPIDLRYYELRADAERKQLEAAVNSNAKLQATKHESPYWNKDLSKEHQDRNGPTNQQQQQQQGSLVRPSDGNYNKHYAASFINVTAPMVPPLSATEAMESAVANQVGGKGLLHQLSAFHRVTPSPVATPDHQLGPTASTTTERPQRAQSLYYMPSQPIYSQPANQFSPLPLLNQLVDESAQQAAATQNSSSAEERTRLDRTDFMMSTGSRSKPQIFWPTASTAQPNMSSTTTIHQASGFRSPLAQSAAHYPSSIQSPLVGPPSIWPATKSPSVSSYLAGSLLGSSSSSSSFGPNVLEQLMRSNTSSTASSMLASNETSGPQQVATVSTRPPPTASTNPQVGGSSTNGFITGGALNLNQVASLTSDQISSASASSSSSANVAPSAGGSSPAGLNRRVFNLTRVEHISAECSNDLIRTVIIFNGTFKGIIYSSGYVRDPNCMYINGTGKTRYDFSIRLNQCGTLGRQEVHPSSGPNEVRRRDQVMWNTLSIQYNPIVEQEWDEHFRVSCEYGSDFWKTVSFSPFNVETNTGSPVVFTVDPPQCQMEILRGHGMVGPRQEVVSGPVTVGDPLTLLIHMKSEKAGYDILVKNCIAHNGGHQKMQLIDPNGCVVNERFISPFRGTYNGNDMKHVTLYSYLKAFRFTGSPVLYLECEIHMCQSACPPQMCYWRRLSKRSAPNGTQIVDNDFDAANDEDFMTLDDQNLSKNSSSLYLTTTLNYKQLDEEGGEEVSAGRTNSKRSGRKLRKLDKISEDEQASIGLKDRATTPTPTSRKDKLANGNREQQQAGQISDKVSLFQALEVRQERETGSIYSHDAYVPPDALLDQPDALTGASGRELLTDSTRASSLMCYRRAELLAFIFTGISLLLVAIGVSIGCCWRAAALRQKAGVHRVPQVQSQQQKQRKKLATSVALSASADILTSGPLSAGAYSNASSGYSDGTASETRSSSQYLHNHNQHHHRHHYQNGSSNHLLSTSEFHKTLNPLAPILGRLSTRHKNRAPL